MNEENDWDHNAEEVPVDCVSRHEVVNGVEKKEK